ncbi:hypothetical protein C8R44DRAFT_981406 [Mycena epipterygia]|nr:hypothetical protein C8R44DRAFT_981406 [Mycena epipterygia]
MATNISDLCAFTHESIELSSVIADPDLSRAFNPDVLGFAVRISSFVMNICAVILLRYGEEKDADTAIQGMLIQIGSIVLCTLISLARHRLTFFDGLFTMAVVHSPIAWYILWIKIRHCIDHWKSGRPQVAQHIPPSPPHTPTTPNTPYIDTALCLAIVVGWIILHVLVWSKGRKFPGENCGVLSFKTYLLSVVGPQGIPGVGYFIGDGWALPLVIMAPITAAIYFLRYYAHNQKLEHGRKRIFYSVHLIFKNHKWVFHILLLISYYSWSFLLVIWTIEPDYSFTYGQSLSAIAAVPSVLAVITLFAGLTREDLRRARLGLASQLVFLRHGNGKRASSINEKRFHNKLSLFIPEDGWDELPVTQPSTPVISTPPNPTFIPGAEETSAADSDTASATGDVSGGLGRQSLDISETRLDFPLEHPLQTAGSGDVHLAWVPPSADDTADEAIPLPESPTGVPVSAPRGPQLHPIAEEDRDGEHGAGALQAGTSGMDGRPDSMLDPNHGVSDRNPREGAMRKRTASTNITTDMAPED